MPQIEPQWLWAKSDWDLFAKEINNKLRREAKFIIGQKECDNMVNHFYNSINKALKVALPKSKPKIVDRNNPWWNSYLSRQRRKLDTLYKHQKANKGFCAKEKSIKHLDRNTRRI